MKEVSTATAPVIVVGGGHLGKKIIATLQATHRKPDIYVITASEPAGIQPELARSYTLSQWEQKKTLHLELSAQEPVIIYTAPATPHAIEQTSHWARSLKPAMLVTCAASVPVAAFGNIGASCHVRAFPTLAMPGPFPIPFYADSAMATQAFKALLGKQAGHYHPIAKESDMRWCELGIKPGIPVMILGTLTGYAITHYPMIEPSTLLLTALRRVIEDRSKDHQRLFAWKESNSFSGYSPGLVGIIARMDRSMADTMPPEERLNAMAYTILLECLSASIKRLVPAACLTPEWGIKDCVLDSYRVAAHLLEHHAVSSPIAATALFQQMAPRGGLNHAIGEAMLKAPIPAKGSPKLLFGALINHVLEQVEQRIDRIQASFSPPQERSIFNQLRMQQHQKEQSVLTSRL